jgi:hypothetical protein
MRQSALLLCTAVLSFGVASSARSEDAQSVEIIGPPAVSAPLKNAADDPSAVGAKYFAVVRENGKLERGSEGTSSELFGFRGQYRVVFPKDVDVCGFVVGQARATAAGAMPVGFTSAQSLSYDKRSLIVITTDIAGSLKGRSFHVLVVCP